MAVAGLATFGLADNPISTYHYLADPAAAADKEYFYIITDSDDPAAADAKDYDIRALYAFRSKDMKNWTDFGIIYDARKVDGIGGIWASGIAVDKNGKFHIVFPDGGGGGIGIIEANSIDGPYRNPVVNNLKLIAGDTWDGKQRAVHRSCDGIEWCFDPGIFIDDDGTAYVTWGGGENANRPNTDNFNIIKLNEAMNNVSGSYSRVKVNNLPVRKMLEASYIHKHGNNYYFSYSTGWQDGAPTIDYAMSNNVLGPYTWKGTILDDPNMNGQSINGNNNHHGIAEFKGHSYAVYHDRRIAKGHNGLEIIPADDGRPNPNAGYHRSVSIEEMFYNADGTIQKVKFTNEGPEQIENFDPYDWYPALTSSKQKGIRSRSNFVLGQKTEYVLLPLSSRKESWIRVSGVDFGTAATGFTVEAASTTNDNTIEIRTGSATGTLAGTCTIAKTANKSTFVENKCMVEGLKGIVEQVFLVFKGKQDSTMAIKAWGFEGSGSTPATPHSPYNGKAIELPGIIQAENYDIPGTGRGTNVKSYSDSDSEHKGDAEFRTSEGVDIVLVDEKDKTKGMAIGYTATGEWLEYTVNVSEEAEFAITASASTGMESAKFCFLLDEETPLGDTIVIPQTGTDADGNGIWSVYKEFDGGKVKISKGTHEIRLLILGDNVNVDWFKFEKIGANGEVIEIKEDPTSSSSTDKSNSNDGKKNDATAIFNNHMHFNGATAANFEVFDLKGKMIASFSAKNMAEAVQLWKNGNVKGDVRVSGINIIRNRANGMVTKIRVNK